MLNRLLEPAPHGPLINTAILALIVSLAADATPGVYDQHLAKMAEFLYANRDGSTHKVAVHKAWAAIKRPSVIKVGPEVLQQSFITDNYKSDRFTDGWNRLQAAI